MARPKAVRIIELNGDSVYILAKYGMTNSEIADFFAVNETTIRNHYSENLIKARADMKLRLRQMQWKSAKSGNVTMQIWLGKQMLGQREDPMPEDKDDEFIFE